MIRVLVVAEKSTNTVTEINYYEIFSWFTSGLVY